MDLKEYLAQRLRDDPTEARRSEDLAVGIAFANNLMRIRRTLGFTQAQLAERAGTTQPRIASYEGGDANPTLRVLGRLSRALDVDVSRLVKNPPDYLTVFPIESALTVSGLKWEGHGWVALPTSPTLDKAEAGRADASIRISDNFWRQHAS